MSPLPGSPTDTLTTTPAVARRAWLPPLLDVVCLLAFAAAGKGSHEAGASEWVVLAIVWPYVVAALLAHAALHLRGRTTSGTSAVWPDGVLVLAVTYVLGMVLRVVSGRGIAVGFLVVAAVFLAVTMLGWRAVAALVARRRARA